LLVFAGYALIQNLYLFLIICILNGIKWAAFYGAGLAWVSDLAPEDSYGRELGYYSGSQSAGWIFGPLLGGFLADIYSLQTMFIFVIIFPLIGFILLIPLKESRKRPILPAYELTQ
jgi:DHA1 family multidrug resistance protein-like MFS transporter